MKSKCIKRENLLDGSVVAIVETHVEESHTVVDRYGNLVDFPAVSFSCYVIPAHQYSDPEILAQNSTLEECETAFIETLENDLCDLN